MVVQIRDSILRTFPKSTSLQIEVLPEIVEAVNGKVPVIIDGGVRLGTDVLKALAIGADAVFVGRPVLWGLAVKGEEGVENILSILRNELEIEMMLCGAAKVKDIARSMVVHESYFEEKMKSFLQGKKLKSNGFRNGA